MTHTSYRHSLSILRALVATAALCLIASSQVCSQATGLVVDYNLYDNVITYTLDGRVVDEPSVKKGQNIYVQISEFNPYSLTASVSSEQLSYSQSSVPGELSSGGAGSSLLSGVGSLFGGLNMGSSLTSAYSGIPGSRGASDLQVMEAQSRFESLTASLSAVEQEMAVTVDKINRFKQAESSISLAASDIESLKSNPHLRPSRMKEIIEEEIKYAFAKSDSEGIALLDVLDGQTRAADLQNTIKTYQQQKTAYAALSQEWKELASSVQLLASLTEDARFSYIVQASDSVQTIMSRKIGQSSEQFDSITVNQAYIEQSRDQLAKLRQVYEELQGDIFTYKFPPLQAENDEIVVDISVSRLATSTAPTTAFKQLTQRIPVYGGWKVTAGIGLAFNVLAGDNTRYSIVDDLIVGEDADQFTPAIVSFAHVYRQRASDINFAGSFGVGLPIFNGEGGQSASFYLGPTLIVGKRQKFLISAGLSGSRVVRLAGGLELGDSYTNSLNTLPTRNSYELGYFVSISYDILN